MYRQELITALRKKLKKDGITKAQITKVLSAFEAVTTETLMDGDEINLRGFLKIYVEEPKPRTGYNPHTKKIETFEPVKKVKARIGETLQRRINSANK